MKIATQPTPALSDRVDGVPPELLKLIGAMMEKEPSARPQSFAEVAERLTPFLDDESPLALRAPGSSASIPDAASTQTVLAMPAATTIQERATQIPKWGWGAGAAGVLALFLLFSGGDDEEGATDAQAEESGDEDVEDEAQLVRLQISTTPKGATLTLDGEEVKNPYDEELEKDSKIRELVVSAKGYKDQSVELVLSRDQMLSLALEKKPPSKAKKTSGSGAQQSGSGSSSSGSSPSGSSAGKNRDSTTSSGGKKAPKPLRDIHNGLKKLF